MNGDLSFPQAPAQASLRPAVLTGGRTSRRSGSSSARTTWPSRRTETHSVKGKNIRHDPRVMLAVDDERPPFAFVLVEGSAVVGELSPAELLPWATRIANRYMGAEQADAYGKRNAVAGEILVRVPLSKVTAQRGGRRLVSGRNLRPTAAVGISFSAKSEPIFRSSTARWRSPICRA